MHRPLLHICAKALSRPRLAARFSIFGEETEELRKLREQKIKEMLLRPKDIVENNQRGFLGMLVVCPTPVGNIRDVSLRVLEVLETADIIACEDTRNAGKLFTLLREKRIKDQFEELQKGNDPPAVFEDASIFGEGEREHPHMGSIRREKQRIKEIYQKEEFSKAIESSKAILKDLDTFRFQFGKSDEAKKNQNYFDSRGNKVKDKAIYGLDNPYIEYLREKVRESKLEKGRGLFMSVHKFNESGRIDKLIQALQAGFIVALISDAGTPTISDPGSNLVDACIQHNIVVEALPGPNVISIALSASGFPSDRFIFSGYLSKTPYIRDNEIQNIKKSAQTAVLFENKNRLLNLLRSIENHFGSHQQVYIGIELTKMHERHLRGEVATLFEELNSMEDYKSASVLGEVTLIIPPRTPRWNKELKAEPQDQNDDSKEKKGLYQIDPQSLVTILKDRLDIGAKDLSELTADILNIPTKDARTYVQKTMKTKTLLYKKSSDDN